MNDEIKCSFCGCTHADGEMNMLVSNTSSNVFICEDCIRNGFAALENSEKQKREESVYEDPELLTPEDIKEYLDQYVIGQDRAKEILSVALYNHMKLLEHWDNLSEGDVEVEKSNILMFGPSGIYFLLALNYLEQKEKLCRLELNCDKILDY